MVAVKLLLAAGAKTHIVNKDGLLPIDLVEDTFEEAKEIKRMLLKARKQHGKTIKGAKLS